MPIGTTTPETVIDNETIILTSVLRAQIKLRLDTVTFPDIQALHSDIQIWLYGQNKFLNDSYVLSHCIAVIEGQPLQTNWLYETRPIRCILTNADCLRMLAAHDELNSYAKAMGIPFVTTDGSTTLYFNFVYPEHQMLMESFNAKFENKI